MEIIDFSEHIKEITATPLIDVLCTLGIPKAKFYDWQNRKKNNKLADIKPIARNPLSLLPEEQEAILNYASQHQGLGYRRLTFMMIDENVVCASPATIYRVLKHANMMLRPSLSSTLGNKPPLPSAPNQKWHTDLMYLNIEGQFYYYQAVIDAYSRYIVAWNIHLEGTALNTGLLLQEAFDRSPQGITPDIIADNGKEFLGKEFREVVVANQGKRIKIKAYHPQSNGIDERHHRTLREECTNGANFENIIEAKHKVGEWIKAYNYSRLHSAIEYMPPIVWHQGNSQILREERKEKIRLAIETRKAINLSTAS